MQHAVYSCHLIRHAFQEALGDSKIKTPGCAWKASDVLAILNPEAELDLSPPKMIHESSPPKNYGAHILYAYVYIYIYLPQSMNLGACGMISRTPSGSKTSQISRYQSRHHVWIWIPGLSQAPQETAPATEQVPVDAEPLPKPEAAR